MSNRVITIILLIFTFTVPFVIASVLIQGFSDINHVRLQDERSLDNVFR